MQMHISLQVYGGKRSKEAAVIDKLPVELVNEILKEIASLGFYNHRSFPNVKGADSIQIDWSAFDRARSAITPFRITYQTRKSAEF